MQPRDFWILTPGEFHQLVAGHVYRQRKQLEREAGWVCVVANAAKQGGRTLRPEDLIGRSPEQQKALEEEVRRRKARRQQPQQETP